MKRSLSSVALLLFLSSCGITPEKKGGQSKVVAGRSKKNQKQILKDIKIQEAKQADIPIPVSATSLSRQYHVDADRVMLGYRDYTLSPQDLVTFYEHEMERLGWRSIFAVSGYESVLQFEKPDRLCIVSIRPHSTAKYVEWVISTGFFHKKDMA